jgi:hypothetical protein
MCPPKPEPVDCSVCQNGTNPKGGGYTAFGRKCLACGRHLASSPSPPK